MSTGTGDVVGKAVAAAATGEDVIALIAPKVVALGAARNGVVPLAAKNVQFLHVSDGVHSAAAVWLGSGGERGGKSHPDGVAREGIRHRVVARAAVYGVVARTSRPARHEVIVPCTA